MDVCCVVDRDAFMQSCKVGAGDNAEDVENVEAEGDGEGADGVSADTADGKSFEVRAIEAMAVMVEKSDFCVVDDAITTARHLDLI